MKTTMIPTRTKTTTKTSKSSSAPAIPSPLTLESRVALLEQQILALQLVIRETAGYADAIGEDVNDVMDEVFGEGDAD